METVVEEKPLSFATSRIVTIASFLPLLDSAGDHLKYNGCWRTLQQRVQRVSSTARIIPLIIFAGIVCLGAAQEASAHGIFFSAATLPTSPPGGPARQEAGAQELYQRGEAALRAGDLEKAEASFRAVLALAPQDVGARANLGVIYMRHKQWKAALQMLRQAEKLAPQVAGIRLNIGLVYYREGNFHEAIDPLASVVRDAPNSAQARHLLGLCYFFTGNYADAATTLAPLWDAETRDLNYLYVLGISAGKSGRPELEEKALSQMVTAGADTPEFHLLMGKAHINREEYDPAISELLLALKADPKLPFAHFNLGVAYLRKQDLQKAKSQFLADAALEPEVPYNYDQLGVVYYLLQDDDAAERNLRKALHLDPSLASSHFELARVYQREAKYAQALAEIDATRKLDSTSYSVHYVRGQILQKLGRTEEARAEMKAVTTMMESLRSRREQELYGGQLPSPELTGGPR